MMRRLTLLAAAALILLLSAPAPRAGARAFPGSPGTACTEEDLPRPMEVTLRWRGTVSRVTSREATVGQLLQQLELVPTPEDILSPGPEAAVTHNMVISVDHVITRRETYTVTLPHAEVSCRDASLPEGTRQVLIPGRDGELLCRAEVTYRNGRETGRRLLEETQTIPPVTQVTALGTAPAGEPETPDMPVISDGYIRMPSGELLTYYKTDYVTATGYTHTDAGCDLITATGTTVRYGTAAVDPRFIPYGTRMLIVSHDGERYYGIATAEDCGGAIKRDKMDLYFPTYDDCIQFGKRRCTVYFLG